MGAMGLRPRLWASSRPLISRRWCAGWLSGAMPPSTRFFLVASVLWRLASIVFEKLGTMVRGYFVMHSREAARSAPLGGELTSAQHHPSLLWMPDRGFCKPVGPQRDSCAL